MKQTDAITNNSLVERRSLDLERRAMAPYPPWVNNHHRDSDDRAHLQEFLFSLRKYRWMIIGITVLSTALVAFYMARQPDLYEARARVQVDLENSTASLAVTKGATLSGNSANDPAYFNTQLQGLTSPRLMRQVVKQLKLMHDPSFVLRRSDPQPTLPEISSGQPSPVNAPATPEENLTDANEAVSREDLAEASQLAPYVESIKTSLKVEPVKETRLPIKETRLIDLTYSHTNPQLAARVLNSIVDTFVVSNLKRKTGNNKVTGDVLQQRIGELQTQIKTKENQLLEYAKNHQILTLDANQNTVVERLVGLNRQLLEAENERKVAEAAYQSALAPGAADALASGSAREASEIESRLSQLRQRRSQLAIEFTAAWPEVREVDSQIAALERQSRQLRNRASSVVITNLSTQRRQTLAREQALRAAYDRQRGETLAQNEAAVNYRILQQEIETNRGLLEGMLQRSNENEAALAAMRNNIHVSDYATVPTLAVGPQRLVVTGVAFALALGLAVGIAVFLGYIDDSVRSTEDLERTLQLRPVAAIPLIRGRHRWPAEPAVFLEQSGNGRQHQDLILETDFSAPFVESYRQLRTSLLLSSQRGDIKSLLVTSSLPGEGKTTTAVNTALTSRQNRRPGADHRC